MRSSDTTRPYLPAKDSLIALSKMPAWTVSKSEELIAVAWLIAGLEAWQARIYWLAWILFVKSAMDCGCALMLAIIEKNEMSKSTDGKARVDSSRCEQK